MKETKHKSIGALGEARAENARLKRKLEAAEKMADAAEIILEALGVGEGWITLRTPDGKERILFHRRADFVRSLLYALCRYRKFSALSPLKQAAVERGIEGAERVGEMWERN